MNEIAALQKQIGNYSKTRDVYAAYRKAGYSKKYYAEHETEILLLHKAAKAAFDALHLQKLPTMKTLQVEYAELLAEKKKAYAEYTTAKKEMQEVLTAKANVDRLLGAPAEQPEKRKSRPSDSAGPAVFLASVGGVAAPPVGRSTSSKAHLPCLLLLF